MPEFSFDEKAVKRAAKYNKARSTSMAIEDRNKVRELIAPTIINSNIIANTMDILTIKEDNITVTQDKYLYKDFVMVKYFLIEALADCIPSAQRLFKLIFKNLVSTSNIVSFTYSAAKQFGVGKYDNDIDEAIKSLVSKQIIFYTNMKSTYVINHTMYFKGNWDRFCRLYQREYGNLPPETYYNADEKRLYIKDFIKR